MLPFSTTICDAQKESIPPSQNLPRPPRICPPSLSESNPPSSPLYMRHSYNLPLPPRIYPLLNIHICDCGTLPESIPLSQNMYTPLLNIYTRASRNLPPALFYNVILTESTPLSCLDKCAYSRRRIYRAYQGS